MSSGIACQNVRRKRDSLLSRLTSASELSVAGYFKTSNPPATLATTRAKKMKMTRWISLVCLAFLPLASHAQINDAVGALKILPAPKDVRLGQGRFVIKPSTTILIGNSNSEDRTAAETLQKEIQDRIGIKLSIGVVTDAPKTTGHISLG